MNRIDWWNFIKWNIYWRLIDILFLYFINSVAFLRKIQIYCFYKNLVFPGNHCVFEFSWQGNQVLAEIWVLNHFLRTSLSCDFWRLSMFPSELFVWNSSGNFFSLPNVKQYKICELNYQDQKIHRTPTHDIWQYWTTALTLLGLISSVYRNLHHWRLNQRPQIHNINSST